MKSIAFKFLAVAGVALAAYPVVSVFRPDRVTVPDISAEIGQNNLQRPAAGQGQSKSETAYALSQTDQLNGTGAQVVIKPDPAGHFIVQAMINDFAIPVMFDTGASIMALKFEDAIKVGIRLSSGDFRSQIQTANGLAPAAEVMLKKIRIDGIIMNDVPAMVLPPGKLETSLLGRSFWGRLKSGFSYASGNLILKN